MATSEGSTDIRVITPLPSNMVMSLSRLIDQAWPGAELASGNRGEITFRVKQATARELSDEEVADAVVEPGDNEAVVRDLQPGGVSLATQPISPGCSCPS